MSAPRPEEEHAESADRYYLVASSRASRRRKRILSHGDLFGVFDLTGDVPTAGLEDLGLFFHGTRHLDRLELFLNGDYPHFLDSRVSGDNVELVTDLTNADVRRVGGIEIPRDVLAVRRVKTLAGDRLYERIELHNYYSESIRCDLVLRVHADFVDIFELRGLTRPARGEQDEPAIGADGITFTYHGRDGRRRDTIVTTDPAIAVSADGFRHALTLGPGERWALELAIGCRLESVPPSSWRPFEQARAVRREIEGQWHDQQATVVSSNELLNDWLRRSAADLAMLRAESPDGVYVYAGIPWFATIFGRDGIITALETLAFAPMIAHGTLHRLAALQGREENAVRDEQPGKIVHEVRDDEMAACGEVPFGRYYGSVDSTPLFLMLAAAYVRRTGDLATASALWDPIERALEWIDRYGDRDGDGYVEYCRATEHGLANQGWKDSHDAIFHADGRLAEPPIALVEVQAYVYAAWRGIARVARQLGKSAIARALDARATELRQRFHRDFWMEDEGFYALALDADKRPCAVVTSNPGHALYAGIVPRAVASRVASRFMRPDLFCGWGVRTVSGREPRFNPMSYHDGSVWPHDNALLTAGLRRYGASTESLTLTSALFDASRFVESFRMPELFCGFERRDHGAPVPYPVACQPQAWAAASVFLLVQAMIGLRFDPSRQRIVFDRPALPSWLEWVAIRNLRCGNGRVDVRVTGGRHASSSVEVTRRDGHVEVVVWK
jgi:glycogen debranching enzyme